MLDVLFYMHFIRGLGIFPLQADWISILQMCKRCKITIWISESSAWIFYLLTDFTRVFITYFLFLRPLNSLQAEKISANLFLMRFLIGTQNNFALLTGCQLGTIYAPFLYTLLSHCKSEVQHIFRYILFKLLLWRFRFTNHLFCTLKNSFVCKIICYAL